MQKVYERMQKDAKTLERLAEKHAKIEYEDYE